jgi:hypothetical protein
MGDPLAAAWALDPSLPDFEAVPGATGAGGAGSLVPEQAVAAAAALLPAWPAAAAALHAAVADLQQLLAAGWRRQQQQRSAAAWLAAPSPAGAFRLPPAAGPAPELVVSEDVPLARLQRIIKLSNADGRGRLDTPAPPDVQDALTQGLASYSRLTASPAVALLAVAKGTWVAMVDMTHHAADMAAGSFLTPAASRQADGSGTGSATTLVRHNARFHVLSVALDQVAGRHLAVAGLRDLELWCLEAKGKVADRLVLSLPFDKEMKGALDVVAAVEWLPGSDTWLAVTTPCAVAIYDVAHSVAQPRLLVTLPRGDLIRGAAFAQRLVVSEDAATPTDRLAVRCFVLSSSTLHSVELPNLQRLAACSAAGGLGAHPGPQPPQQCLEAPQLQLPYDLTTLSSTDGLSYSPASGLLQLAVTTAAGVGTLLLLQPSHDLAGVEAAALALPASEQVMAVRPLHEARLLPAARQHFGAASLLACTLQQRQQQQPTPALLALQQPAGQPLKATLQPLQLKGTFESPVEGVAHIVCPTTSQTIIVLLDARASMHFVLSTKVPELQPLEPFATLLQKESAGRRGAGAGGSNLGAAPAAAGQQQQEQQQQEQQQAATLMRRMMGVPAGSPAAVAAAAAAAGGAAAGPLELLSAPQQNAPLPASTCEEAEHITMEVLVSGGGRGLMAQGCAVM